MQAESLKIAARSRGRHAQLPQLLPGACPVWASCRRARAAVKSTKCTTPTVTSSPQAANRIVAYRAAASRQTRQQGGIFPICRNRSIMWKHARIIAGYSTAGQTTDMASALIIGEDSQSIDGDKEIPADLHVAAAADRSAQAVGDSHHVDQDDRLPPFPQPHGQHHKAANRKKCFDTSETYPAAETGPSASEPKSHKPAQEPASVNRNRPTCRATSANKRPMTTGRTSQPVQHEGAGPGQAVPPCRCRVPQDAQPAGQVTTEPSTRGLGAGSTKAQSQRKRRRTRPARDGTGNISSRNRSDPASVNQLEAKNGMRDRQ